MRPQLSIDCLRGHSFVANWLPKGGTVVDLGMNRGEFARQVCEKYACRVVGAEPNPILASQIIESEAIRCREVAVSASTGMVAFRIDPSNSEAGTICMRHTLEESGIVQVSSMPLSEFLQANNVGQVDLIKIDIEGAEIELLKAIDQETLSKISQISIEFHAFIFPEQKQEIKYILQCMHKNGLYSIDFSRNFSDVLLINQQRNPLSQRDRLSLTLHKYRAGMKRRLQRLANRDCFDARALRPHAVGTDGGFGSPSGHTEGQPIEGDGLPGLKARLGTDPHRPEPTR